MKSCASRTPSAPLWKSLLIVWYLAWILFAGIAGLKNWQPFTAAASPWTSWLMVVHGSPYHQELAAYGWTALGTRIELPVKALFPMPPLWIDRGKGRGIVGALWGMRRISPSYHARAMQTLCRYILRTSDQTARRSDTPLKAAEVVLAYWPLDRGPAFRTDYPLARCARDQ